MKRRCVTPVAVAAVAGAQWPASWTAPQRPRHIFGNVYRVGARVRASLIASADGHVEHTVTS